MNDCIFCKIAAGEIPAAKVYEDEHTVAFFDMFPATRYHTLVVPKKHFENMFDADAAELAHLMNAVKKVADIYAEKLGFDNIQIVNANGAAAQQSVMHLHYHIIPRHKDDGLDIEWPRHPECQGEFDEMLKKLKN